MSRSWPPARRDGGSPPTVRSTTSPSPREPAPPDGRPRSRPAPARELLPAPGALGHGARQAAGHRRRRRGDVSLTRANSQRVVNVPVVGDASDEPNETFVVNLSNLTAYPEGSATPRAWPRSPTTTTPVLSIDDVSVAEGNTGTRRRRSRHPSPRRPRTRSRLRNDHAGTATAGTDYIGGERQPDDPCRFVQRRDQHHGEGRHRRRAQRDLRDHDLHPVNATIGDGSGVDTTATTRSR